MASEGKFDPVSGRHTTGHEWDGIAELNTPLPKWWVYVFYACIVWAIGYWVLYPSIPTLDGYWQGTLGWHARSTLETELVAQKESRKVWTSKIEKASLQDIVKDKSLLNYALAGGKATFNENCAPCHGVGGVGAYGFPNLADDVWLWGGTLDDIYQTIQFGVRNSNPNSRQSEMPKFGDGILKPDEISKVADYVLTLPKGGNASLPGAAIFAENCVACHGATGEGSKDVGAPALKSGVWLYKGTKEAIVAQVTAPKHGNMPAWSERLDPVTIKQLAVYVHSLGGGQ